MTRANSAKKISTALLSLKGLHVRVEGAPILRGIDLKIEAGEVHAIMGPNGSGKSTLALMLAGHEDYAPQKGTMMFLGQDLSAMLPEARAAAGLFLGFQSPVDIPGLGVMSFLRASLNAIRKARGEKEMNPADFLRLCRNEAERLHIGENLLRRNVHEGFSGGEKKRLEILHMMLLKPRLAVLDEIDSGLDVDSLKDLGEAVGRLRADKTAILLITHYQRLLDYIDTDKVHVLGAGRIRDSGGEELAQKIDQEGFGLQ